MSVRDGPGEGTWSVFAQKVVEERDAARANVARLERELAEARAEAARSAAAAVDAARELGHVVAQVAAERDALRAIVEGRVRAPSVEERAAHAAAHPVGDAPHYGRWLVRANIYEPMPGDPTEYVIVVALSQRSRTRILRDTPVRWWPLAADGTPVAWPVTGGAT